MVRVSKEVEKQMKKKNEVNSQGNIQKRLPGKK